MKQPVTISGRFQECNSLNGLNWGKVMSERWFEQLVRLDE